MTPTRTALLALLATLLAGSLVSTPSADARQLRYAVVIGNNDGEPEEERLLFAERDAVRVADVLSRLGGVPNENVVLLRGADADSVVRGMHILGRRIEEQRRKEPDLRPVVFVYYSGHAGAQRLHLSGTRLSFRNLTRAVKATGAEVGVVVVDACHSGGLTRVKGGVKAKPFAFDVRNELDTSGMAIITSSADGEDAQESDRLRGGVFTHHLVTGLLGVADSSRDGTVSLTEAYRYAHDQTVRTTSSSRFIQHPTYSFQLRGKQELIVTRLAGGAGLGAVQLGAAGSYLILEDEGAGPIVAELTAREPGALVRLTPGRYLIRKRGRHSVSEAVVAVRRSHTARIGSMRQQPYGRTVRKGLASESGPAIGVTAGGEVSGPMLPGLSIGSFGTIGVQLDFRALTVNARMRYGRAGASNNTVTLTQDSLGVDLGAIHVFDIPYTPIGLGLGVRLGGDYVWQTFEAAGTAPPRSQWIWRAAPVVRAEFAVHPRVSLTVDGGADITLVEAQDVLSGAIGLETSVVPFATLGITVYLP
ncbi:MAG: hypothetical protein ACI9WU_004979 [Myxococcota bacterium]